MQVDKMFKVALLSIVATMLLVENEDIDVTDLNRDDVDLLMGDASFLIDGAIRFVEDERDVKSNKRKARL
jgi:hypothetical protein